MSTLKKKIASARTSVPHVFVVARAGSGKTTTLVEGLKVIKGQKPSIAPSPQQEAVWEAMKLSQNARTVAFTAFNKSIASELKQRVPAGVEAKTMHGMGFGAVNRFCKLRSKDSVDGNKTYYVLEDLTGIDSRKMDKVVRAAVNKLVGLCKSNLLEPDNENLISLALEHGLELGNKERRIFGLTRNVLDVCLNDVEKYGYIDFNDMIWLPVAMDLPVFKFDLLLVDEAQDLNRCQQELALKAGKRLIFCGDPKQAIYGFAGADTRSMKRLYDRLVTTEAGAVELPLTVTRRCGHAIVKHVNRLVPDLEAHETNPKGNVSQAWLTGEDKPEFPIGPDSDTGEYLKGHDPEKWSYHNFVKDGDMILCRTNAPLISQCFKFLSKKRKANIQGRDIGKNLISIIKSTKAKTVEELHDRVIDWYDKMYALENKKKFPSENLLIALADKRDCIKLLSEGHDTVEEVIKKIEDIFTDDKTDGILLSSGHKAKGLEAKNVFILALQAVPHPMAKTKDAVDQEYNLQYVMETRALESLTYVYNRK